LLYGDSQRVSQSLKDRQPLDRLNVAFNLGHPALRPAYLGSQLLLRHASSLSQLLNPCAERHPLKLGHTPSLPSTGTPLPTTGVRKSTATSARYCSRSARNRFT